MTRFYPNLAFGRIELLDADGSVDLEIPARLLDLPDVLAALTVLAKAGGTAAIKRGPIGSDVSVDLKTGLITFEESFL